MAFKENLNVYFRNAPTVAIGENQIPIPAIFDADYTGLSEASYVSVDSQIPAITVKSCDAEALAISRHTQIRIAGTLYYPRSLQPDGSGITVIFLNRNGAGL